jgi:hypothetical protein
MDASNRIAIRRWRALPYRDARVDLVNLGRLQGLLDKAGTSPVLDDLRNHELKKYLEMRQAALFTYLVGETMQSATIGYAMYEDADHDCIIRWRESRRNCYVAVQLKEIVPVHLNPKADLSAELEKQAKKYTSSSHTVAAFHVNQSGLLDFSRIRKPDATFSEIWLYGALSPNQSQWFLFGDLLKEPKLYEFSYPS